MKRLVPAIVVVFFVTAGWAIYSRLTPTPANPPRDKHYEVMIDPVDTDTNRRNPPQPNW